MGTTAAGPAVKYPGQSFAPTMLESKSPYQAFSPRRCRRVLTPIKHILRSSQSPGSGKVTARETCSLLLVAYHAKTPRFIRPVRKITTPAAGVDFLEVIVLKELNWNSPMVDMQLSSQGGYAT